jgi:hypothetical protein
MQFLELCINNNKIGYEIPISVHFNSDGIVGLTSGLNYEG